MAGYSREFLVSAYMSRLITPDADIAQLERLELLAYKLYDEVGRDRFRERASLTAERIREYKQKLQSAPQGL